MGFTALPIYHINLSPRLVIAGHNKSPAVFTDKAQNIEKLLNFLLTYTYVYVIIVSERRETDGEAQKEKAPEQVADCKDNH